MFLGLDLGSYASKGVLLDEGLRRQAEAEVLTRGDFSRALKELAEALLLGRSIPAARIGLTGSGRTAFSPSPKVLLVNDIVALAMGTAIVHPEARSAIEIGAESARWLDFGDGPEDRIEREILDFALNEACAAGSGAFLAQQAGRLKLSLEEFASLAASARRGARVAGRCSVFAKTDMIHLQQKGTPIEEIAYGVCLALARNFAATVLKGRECRTPVFLAGGAARNGGLVRAFREILGWSDPALVIADGGEPVAALGAAAAARASGPTAKIDGVEALLGLFAPRPAREEAAPQPLGALGLSPASDPAPGPREFVRGWLGLDVGSVSTNLALLDGEGAVKAGVYVPTRGRPLDALRRGYEALRDKCPAGFAALGIGATGSGRFLAGRLFRADVIRNEISCQLAGALAFAPDVDAVFEIGGQDSKFIRVAGGRIVDFAMNKICAAGTGSFLEEQAEPLGIRIENEFSALAGASASPSDLGSRCTVFMDTEFAGAVARGASAPDLCAGLAYAIARNYLEKVVAGRPLGPRIVFQGGVASNAAVVRAFSLLLGRPVEVHPHNGISGAVGAALLAKRALEGRAAAGHDPAELGRRVLSPQRVSSFECSRCSNHCSVNRISIGREAVFFGDTCERLTSRPSAGGPDPEGPPKSGTPDLFKERGVRMDRGLPAVSRPAGRIAIPRASTMFEYLPFWAAFLGRLGFQVEVSAPTSAPLLEDGLKRLTAETCLPIKILFGHVAALLKTPADWVFFPSHVDLHKGPAENDLLCPYSELAPFIVQAAFQGRFLFPPAVLGSGEEDFLKSMRGLGKTLGVSGRSIREAYAEAVAAQDEFSAALRTRGREILGAPEAAEKIKLAVLGRPYTLYDAFNSLNLGRRLEKLGAIALPMEYLPLPEEPQGAWPGAPPWRYNRQILRSAMWCAETPDLFPVILSNFGCGPDAFALKPVEKILEGKPHLSLEFDEHSAEAGLITRLEAFLDEIADRPCAAPAKPRRDKAVFLSSPGPASAEDLRGRPFVLPYFADQVHAFSGALRAAGYDASIMPLPDGETLALGERHSSGKECHAYSYIAGDLVKLARSRRAGGEVFFFPGAKYDCVLQQYDKSMGLLLEEIGVDNLGILAFTSDDYIRVLGLAGLKTLWQGLVAIDVLVSAACRIRPYEKTKGATDAAHRLNLRGIEAGLAVGTIGPALERCAERLDAVETEPGPRLRIGIVGDIYTRSNPVANHELFLKLESLGCEVWPSPFFVDGVDFSMTKELQDQLGSRRLRQGALTGLLCLRKDAEKRRVKKSLKKAARSYRESTFKDIHRETAAYLSLDNNSTLLLNVAHMVDFAAHGADGVVNAICFNCMLGTVSAALSRRIRRDFGQIPIPTLVFSGKETVQESTKLEAFIYQVRQSAAQRSRGGRLELGPAAP